MAVTIKDIAKIAGVSHSTVSRSLNDSPLISDKTKNRIKEIAQETGFEFNANARALSVKRTGTIGLIYPREFEKFQVNLFYSTLHSYIRDVLEREGLDLISTFPENSYTKESNIKKLIDSKKVDGLIIVELHIDKEIVDYMCESKIPFVLLHLVPDTYLEERADLYCTDHFAGGYIAAEHFIEQGYKNICCINADSPEIKDRFEGFKKALCDNSLSVDNNRVFKGDLTFESGYDIVEKNIKIIKESGSVFAMSDFMALGAVECLKDLKVIIPDEVAIIGYDNIELGNYFKPRLSTINQPRRKLAVLACERLIELMNNNELSKNKEKIILKPSLIIRETCK